MGIMVTARKAAEDDARVTYEFGLAEQFDRGW
jgi:hypothetical protein